MSEETNVRVQPTPVNPINIKGAIAYSAEHSRIWAEGTDEEVEQLGGMHSSKGWSEQGFDEATSYTDEKVAQAVTDLTGEINRQAIVTLEQAKGYTDSQKTPAELGLLGLVKPDGITTTVDVDGTIHSTTSYVNWGNVLGTLSNQTDLQTALNGKVSTSGSTMSGQLIISGITGTHLQLKDTNLDRDTTPGSNKVGDYIDLNDDSGDNIARMLAINTTSGENQMQIEVADADNSDKARMGVSIKQDGTNPYGFCPTPASNSDTNHIATTEWTRDILVQKAGDTMSGQLIVSGIAGTHLQLRDTGLDRDTTPTGSDKVGDFIDLDDASGDNVGRLLVANQTGGTNMIQIESVDGTGTNRSRLGASISVDGTTSFGFCPTPAANSNTNHIATTAWVRTLINDGGPNYSSASSLVWGESYTAQQAGYLLVSVLCHNSQAYLTIGGITITVGGFDANDSHGDSVCVPVSKGDTYSTSGTYATLTAYMFIPMKS